MATVNLEKELAKDLVDTKLRVIHSEIEKILTSWNYKDSIKFIQDAKKGIITEAEDDAITLIHLLDQRDELFQLKGMWQKTK